MKNHATSHNNNTAAAASRFFKYVNMSDFQDLPDELLVEIFCRIDDQYSLVFAEKPLCLVCKRWARIIRTSSFWRQYHHYWKRHQDDLVMFKLHGLSWQTFAAFR